MTMPRIGIAARTTAKTEIGIGTRELPAIRGVVAGTLHQIVAVSHFREKVDDHKKRAGDSRDKKDGQETRDRRRDSSPHPARDQSGNCECTQVGDDYSNVCAFLDAAPVANEADWADDRLLSASIPHPSRNSRIPSLHVDVLPDTGAWSADYINEATAAWLRSVGIKRKDCSVTVCSSGIGMSQQFFVPCRGSYTFDLILYDDLLAGDETISVTANEIPSTYPVLLGRKTIKKNKISLKCFRFFSNLETGESLMRGFVSYNLYAMGPKSHLCSASFSAPTAVAKPQAIVDFQGGEETEPASGWPKERFLTPEPDEDFVDPADEYEMPWEEDTPLPEGVRSKACLTPLR
jgi:hypothetical protein